MRAYARSYARAFVETAPTGYEVEGFLESAGALRRAFAEDRPLKAFFAAPAVPVEAKEKALDELARKVGLDDFGRRFFQLTLSHRRILQLSEILSAIREESDRRRGVVAARVTVAGPLAPAEEQRIAQRLSRALGRAVRLQVDVDEKILAGFVARVGSEVFDASALRAIEKFQEQAKETGA